MSLLFILSFVLVFPFSQASALDTDLYAVTSTEVPPNVMIMFDNSISMNELVSGVLYDPNTTYPLVVTDYPDKVYYRTGGGSWNVYRDSIDGVNGVICDSVKTALQSYGFYTGKISFSSSACGTTNNVNLNTGNYLNYMQVTGGPADKPKLGLAKGIIQSYINTTEGIRFGTMIFNYNEGGHLLREIKDMTSQNRADLHAAIGGLAGDTYTPLAETLYETGLYFKGADSYFNKDAYGNPIKYTSPQQYYCQKNYVIIITDGESTKDRNSILSTAVGDADGDGREPGGANEVPYDTEGSDYLDDVAKTLQDTDLDPVMKENQHITTYTVGFTINSPLLERTAQHGNGRFFYCHNAQEFIIAMQKIIDEILAKSTSYVAPVVPISQMENTSAGDRMYIAMFNPTMKSFWEGNIKKYGIATVKNGSIEVGEILDMNGDPAMDSESGSLYKIREDAKSYDWNCQVCDPGPDGDKVRKGGLGEILQKRTTTRNIYTYLGTTPPSLDPFTLNNTAITPSRLSLPQNDDTGKNQVINFIHGKDAYDENGNKSTNEKRDWILGSFIHSRPVVIHYGETYSVIFAGANDGMLHAFDDDTGEELWAFIPPSLLPNLKNLNGNSIEFFVDGAPKVHIGTDKTVLMFGLRRGGNSYTALDITDRLSPNFLWEISPLTAGFEELGQTWSTPQIGKIQLGTEEKWVAFIGGGYDTNQDNQPVSVKDTKGRAVYVVDILTGALIWSYSYAKDAAMEYCIPSDVARVDTDGNGKIDRLYVGDIGGRIWRFDIGDLNKDGNSETSEWTAKIIFSSNAGTSDHRKIFYPPDVTLEKDSGNYEMLFFGTGDREHPKATTSVVNRLYAVKDKNPSTILSENELVDVTGDLLQDPGTTSEQKTSILQSLQAKDGWFIKLDQNPGEKCLSVPVVFYGIVYYSTFSPTAGSETDICFVGEGTSRLYELKYKTGNAVFNLDESGTIDNLTRSDRSMVVGSAIPSGVIITFIGGTSVGYVGVGGGVYKPTLFSKRSIIPVSWRIVF
jgi:type IV pilus assembly protein PilY1